MRNKKKLSPITINIKKITINKNEVDTLANNLMNKVGKVEYNYSEILFKNVKENDWENTKKRMNTVLSLLESKSSFDLVAKKFDIEDSVKWIKYTSDKEVFSLYKAADVFMCASLYEGFNITPLEALYLETPIICSNLSSLPEVVGDAAYMIEDPTDPVEMTQALGDVLGSEDLRNELRKKGLVQAKKFSWERCALETMQIFENILNE